VPEIHVHLLAAVANGGMVEYMPRSEAILQTMPELSDGDLVAPHAAGLGLTLDEAAVQRFRVG
jgi:L-alanine-DL-glutamate epimerase-like enolase superfamily enzyme